MRMQVYREGAAGERPTWSEMEISEATDEDLLGHISNIEFCNSRSISSDPDTTELDRAVWAEALRRMAPKV